MASATAEPAGNALGSETGPTGVATVLVLSVASVTVPARIVLSPMKVAEKRVAGRA